jgi:hypothetical protein
VAIVDKPDLKTGFWVGLGLVGAFIVWGLVSALMARARGKISDG